MLDREGFRPNVGVVLLNARNQVFWGKRLRTHSWQFPQGGIKEGETPEQAMYRELFEEVGLQRGDVRIVAVSKNWLRYRLPKRLVRQDEGPVCIGQKQKWFLLRLDEQDEKRINLASCGHPEFDEWRWVSYWYPVRHVVPFKRDVYRRAMREFAQVAMPPPRRRQPRPAKG